jgi:glycosyltransferase involved in cell wall biosynthesis
MPDNMKILFFPISGKNGASSRYRVYQFIPYLNDAGISTSVMPPARKPGGLGKLVAGIREESACIEAACRADVVFIQKRLFGKGFIGKLERLGKPLVFDFDDSIFTSPSGDWSFLTRKKVERRLNAVIRAADLVITGNRFLAGYASANGASRVAILPTAIDVSRYSAKKHEDRDCVLGWIGSSVNHRYLDMLSGTLPELAGKYAGLKLLVVSDKDYFMDGIEVENRRWSEDTESADILDMDIGLMPLADDEWTRGKCALKALQYMACGIPAVCSPVGANKEVIEDGVDGFLPADGKGWVERIGLLARSVDMRAEFGSAARVKVEKSYSMEICAEALAGHIGSCLN